MIHSVMVSLILVFFKEINPTMILKTQKKALKPYKESKPRAGPSAGQTKKAKGNPNGKRTKPNTNENQQKIKEPTAKHQVALVETF